MQGYNFHCGGKALKELKKHFGAQLKKWREFKKFRKQKDFATACNTSSANVSRWESGDQEPKEYLPKILEVLNLTETELLAGPPEDKKKDEPVTLGELKKELAAEREARFRPLSTAYTELLSRFEKLNPYQQQELMTALTEIEANPAPPDDTAFNEVADELAQNLKEQGSENPGETRKTKK